MNNDYINISSIETHLDKVIRKYVCKQSYASTLPSTLKESIDSYVVTDCGNAISDLKAYGKGIINIYLYAQPIADGMKNVAALSELEKSFNKALREDKFDTEHYTVPREVAYSKSDYDGTYNMHFIVKAINIIIT